MKEIKIGNQSCVMAKGHYQNNGSLALIAFCAKGSEYEGEQYGTLTVNLNAIMPDEYSVTLDTNNIPDILDIFLREELGEVVGSIPSGWCRYPLVMLDKEKLDEIAGTPEELEKYFSTREES